MHLLVWLATLIFTAFAITVAILARSCPGKADSRFVAIGPLLTESEILFKQHLESVVPDNAQVMVKVRLADLVTIHSASRREFTRRLEQIKSKRIDFVVCERSTCKVLWAIELHDTTHERADRVRRDNLVRGILREAGLPYLEFNAQRSYDQRTLRALMSGKCKAPLLRLVTR